MQEIQNFNAFQITIMKVDPNCPSKESFHIYYINRPEQLSDDEEAEILKTFINFSVKAFTQDFCLRNNLKETEVLPRIEKITYSSYRKEN